jgi:cytosine deaminase
MGAVLACRGRDERNIDGLLILPGFVDAHQHLDKTRTTRRVANPAGTLAGAIDAYGVYARGATRDDILQRARATAEACVARGTVAIRSHADLDPHVGLKSVEALVRLREELRDRVRIQVVAFPTATAMRAGPNVVRGLVDAALDAGADVVGGSPSAAADPGTAIDLLFELAALRDVPLDVHLNENLDPSQRNIEHAVRRAAALGLGGRVALSHCCSLSASPGTHVAPLLAAMARARVAVITLPAANLFLQGRDAPVLAPRGLTRVADLLAAGVPVACGSDNVQDPFIPVGTGDVLELGRWTVLAGHLSGAHVPAAFEMTTSAPAGIIGIAADYGIRVGAYADLVVVDAADPADALMSGPAQRAVVFHGRLVAGALPAASHAQGVVV